MPKKENLTTPPSFSDKIKSLIKRVPRGKVATYGQIAALAGNPLGARQVVRVLHACSDKDKLPWQRIVGSKAKISLPPGRGYETQKKLLLGEGIIFDKNETINFDRFLWEPGKKGSGAKGGTRPGPPKSAGISRARGKDFRQF